MRRTNASRSTKVNMRGSVDMRLEVVTVPVSDVDRADRPDTQPNSCEGDTT